MSYAERCGSTTQSAACILHTVARGGRRIAPTRQRFYIAARWGKDEDRSRDHRDGFGRTGRGGGPAGAAAAAAPEDRADARPVAQRRALCRASRRRTRARAGAAPAGARERQSLGL